MPAGFQCEQCKEFRDERSPFGFDVSSRSGHSKLAPAGTYCSENCLRSALNELCFRRQQQEQVRLHAAAN